MASARNRRPRALGDLKEVWTRRAIAKLGVTASQLVPPLWEEWFGIGDWQQAGNVGGSVSGAYSGAPGEMRAITAAGAGNAYVHGTTAGGKFTTNMRTKRWMIAQRWYIDAVDANTQLFFGLQGRITVTSRAGIGVDGAASTTKMLGGMFTGTFPASTAVADKYVQSTKAPASAYVETLIYNNGTNVVFSVDGEPEKIACASTEMPNEGATLVALSVNCIGGAAAHAMYSDWLFFATER